MKGMIYFVLLLSLLSIISPVNAWSVELKISCGNISKTLVFGFNKNASDSIDEYDLPYPPPLPQQPFYASFIEPDETKYYKENYKSKNLSWTLYIKADKDVKIEWNSTPANLNIILNVNNEYISMNDKSSISLEAGEHILSIKVINQSSEVTTPPDKPSVMPGFEVILVLIGGLLALLLRIFKI